MANRNDWYLHIDKVNYIGPNFVDLKMAFYLVDHKILLKKMSMYGVPGLEHDWFISYLQNHKQFCRIGGTSSDAQEIICGVLQVLRAPVLVHSSS